MSSRQYRCVCGGCRSVSAAARDDGTCVVCGSPVIAVGHRWRAPKASNAIAWSRIAAGEILWDRRAVERAERRAATRRREHERRARAARQAAKSVGLAPGGAAALHRRVLECRASPAELELDAARAQEFARAMERSAHLA